MADIDPKSIEDLNKNLEALGPIIGDFSKAVEKNIKAQSDRKSPIQRIQEDAKNLTKDFEELDEALKAGKITQDQAKVAAKQLSEQQKSLGASTKDVDATLKKYGVTMDDNISKFEKFGGAVGGYAVGFVKFNADMARSVSTSTSAIDAAGTQLSGMADAAGKGATGIGGALKSFGDSVKGAPGAVGKLSGAARFAGMGLQAFGAAMPAITAGMDLLKSQLKLVEDGYKKSSSVGAVFADSYGGFARTAGEAGLNLQQWGNVLQKNSVAVAESGLGAEGFSKKLQQVNKEAPNFQRTLKNLGIENEEAAELQSTVMADMRRAGRDLTQVSGGEIAQQTESYAKSLKMIAAITGEDAKKKEAEARKSMTNLAVQARIQKLTQQGDLTAGARFKAILETVPEGMRDAAQQILAEGKPITAETIAAFKAMGPEGQQAIEMINQAATATNASAEDATKGTIQALEVANKGAQNMLQNNANLGKLSMLGVGGFASDLGKILGPLTADLTKFPPGTAERLKEAIDKAAQTQDPLAKSMVDLQEAVQAQKLMIDKTTIPALSGFADALKTAAQAMTAMQSTGLTGQVLEGLVMGAVAAFGPMLLEKGLGKLFGGKGPPTGGLPGGPTSPTTKGGGGAAVTIEKEAAGKVAGKVENTLVKEGVQMAEKKGLETAGKVVAKDIGKAALKKIPFGVGLLFSLVDAGSRAMAGDYAGAAMSVASGAASVVPGVGTAVSAAIDVAQAGTDIAGLTGGSRPETALSTAENTEAQKPQSDSQPDMLNPSFGGQTVRTDESMVRLMSEQNSILQDISRFMQRVEVNTATTATHVQ
jgi:hypothetical protein